MALGFTSHYTKSEQPFGSLILSNSETETSGSVAYSGQCDSYEFSVSVNVDYSQYANYVCSSSGSTETAGSVAYSGSGAGAVSSGASFGGGGCSVSSGGGCSTSFT